MRIDLVAGLAGAVKSPRELVERLAHDEKLRRRTTRALKRAFLLHAPAHATQIDDQAAGFLDLVSQAASIEQVFLAELGLTADDDRRLGRILRPDTVERERALYVLSRTIRDRIPRLRAQADEIAEALFDKLALVHQRLADIERQLGRAELASSGERPLPISAVVSPAGIGVH